MCYLASLHRQLDLGGAVDEFFVVLVAEAQPDLNKWHPPGGFRLLADYLGVEVRDVALERGSAEVGLGVPNHSVIAGPVGEIVGAPGAHRCAVAIGAHHPDLGGPVSVDMTA